MFRGQGPAAAAVPASVNGTRMPLQENEPPARGRRDSRGVQSLSGFHGKRSDGAAKRGGEEAFGGFQAPGRSLAAGAWSREFGVFVDGSGTDGGLSASPGPRWCGGSGSPRRQLATRGFQSGILSAQSFGRKRPADPSFYVDDEFLDEAESRPAVRPCSTPASSSSAGSDFAFGRQVLSEVRPRLFRDSTPATASEGTHLDDSSISDVDLEDKENDFGPVTRGLHVEHDRVLRELAVEVSLESKDQLYSDVESSDDDYFRSEHLAEQLADRIRRNEGGRYDFEIYVDPESRD